MSFKFFRKHQRSMLWVIVVITVFTFSIFSVQSTMTTCFRGQSATGIGMFTDSNGSEVEITQRMWGHAREVLQHFIRSTGLDRLSEREIIPHIILLHEAALAGLTVTDGELQFTLAKIGIKSEEEYQQRLQMMGFESAKAFEESFRELLLLDKYRRFMTLNDDLVLTEDLYEEYKLENEEFKLSYVTIPAENFTDQVDPASITDEALKAYYDALPLSGSDVRENFSESEKYAFDVAYLDLEKAAYADFEALITESSVEVQDYEVRRLFNETKELYMPPETEDPADDGSAEGAEAETDEAKAAKEREEEDKIFAEVKPLVMEKLKIAKLVEKASFEWTDYARKNDIIGKKDEPEEKVEEEAVPEEPADENAEETPEETPEEAPAEEPTSEEHYLGLIEKYRLSTDQVTDQVSLDDLPTMDRYGSDMLQRRMRSLKVNNAAYMGPDKDHPQLAYFVKVTDLTERRKKELEEVRETALQHLVDKEKMDLAQASARTFEEGLKDKARILDEVKQVIDPWIAEADQKADEEIGGQQITDAQAAQIRESKHKAIEADIDAMLKRYMYKFFDEEAAGLSLPVETVDYYRKSVTRKPEFFEREDSPEKFIMGNHVIFNLDTHGVTAPLRDKPGNSWYVACVLDRRFPPPESMTDTDLEMLKRTVEQKKIMEKRMQQYQPEGASTINDPFSYDTLVAQHKLEYFKKEAEEGEAEGEVPGEAGAASDTEAE